MRSVSLVPAFVCLVSFVAPVSAAPQAVRKVQVVALSSTPAPGTPYNYALAFDPRDVTLSSAGRVLFGSGLSNTDPDYGYWAGDPAAPALVARHGFAAPGTGGMPWDFFTSSHYMMIDRSDYVGLHAARTSNGSFAGFAIWAGPDVAMQRVVGEGDPAPGTDGTFLQISRSSAPAFNQGRTAFYATLAGPNGSSVNSDTDSGIWTGSAITGVSLVARENDDMPGQPAGARFGTFGSITLAQNGDVLFIGNAKFGVSALGLYRSSDGSLTLVADRSVYGTMSDVTVNWSGRVAFLGTPDGDATVFAQTESGFRAVAAVGDAAPDADGAPGAATFTQILHFLFLDDGECVLLAATSDGKRGVWREEGTTLKRLAQKGDAAPGPAGSPTFSDFRNVVANEDRVVCFEATTTASAQSGMWRVDGDGSVGALLIPGDQIEVADGDVRTVTSAKGPFTSPTGLTKIGLAADGRPTFMNAASVLLQAQLNNFSSAALVLVGVSDALVVNHTGNGFDQNPGDGVCDTGEAPVNGETRCTLRAAIQEANAKPGKDTIAFDIPQSDPGFAGGVWRIKPAPVLPVISGPVVLDGTTQPGFAGTPVIVIDGSDLRPVPGDGLELHGGASTVRGFSIVNFAGDAISLLDEGDNVVAGNYLGVDADGVTPGGNNENGVFVNGTVKNRIGGSVAADRNILLDNGKSGTGGANVAVQGPGATGNRILGNWIGVDATGVNTPNNPAVGVSLVDAASNDVGGDAAGEGNVIGGNSYGVRITGSASIGNIVQGNLIGLGADGATVLANRLGGVRIEQAVNTLVGGLADATGHGPGNVISGNGGAVVGHGVDILGDAADGTGVQGNLIGLDASGLVAKPNHGAGVHVHDGDDTTIGGVDERGGNVIAANDSAGVWLELAGTTAVTVMNNTIGLDAAATPRGNGGPGVFVDGAADVSVDTNTLGGNAGPGVLLRGATATGASVLGNAIGTDAAGALTVPNAGDGVRVEGAPGVVVGSTAAGDANTIADNGGAGVRIVAGAGSPVRGNAIFANTGLGIDLGAASGVTPNDPADADDGPNGYRNYPELTAAVNDTAAKTLVVRGVIAVEPGAALTIDLYGNVLCDPSVYGEGESWLGSTAVVTDGAGRATFTSAFPAAGLAFLPTYVTATATDAAGNTSEFSACAAVVIEDTASGAWVVNSTGDAGDLVPGDGSCDTGGLVGGESECTLRAALEESAALAGHQTIRFDIAGPGPHVIRPGAALPAIADVTVDGTSEPDYDGLPAVEVDGSDAGSNDGLALAGGAVVSGLAIGNFAGNGVTISGANNTLLADHLGLAADGVTARPNGGAGILVEGATDSRIGAAGGALPNRIANNGGDGVRVATGTGIAITGNAIDGNGGLGINLVDAADGADGVTPNDAGDVDDGPNHLRNAPVLLSAGLGDGTLEIQGSFAGAADSFLRVELYLSDVCDPSGRGEGGRYVGATDVTTDGAGHATFTAVVGLDTEASPGVRALADLAGSVVTALAVDGDGNTSEFSNCVVATPTPVRLLALTAEGTADGIVVRWLLSDDSDVVACFLLSRIAGSDDAWSPVGESILAGERTPAGIAYRFDDRSAEPGRRMDYLVESLDREGTRARFGPVSAVRGPGTLRVAPARNPFRAGEAIRFELPRSAPVALLIHDVAGRLVRRIDAGLRPAGAQEIAWDGRSQSGVALPAGVYFVSLVTPDARAGARVVLIGR